MLADGRTIAVGAGEGKDLADHLVHARAFRLDAVQVFFRIRSGLPPRELDRDLQPRKRRSQLMRDVGKKLLLRRDEQIQPLCHRVEVAHEVADFIAARPHIEPARRAGRRMPGGSLASRTRLSGAARLRARRKQTTAETTIAATSTGVGMKKGEEPAAAEAALQWTGAGGISRGRPGSRPARSRSSERS